MSPTEFELDGWRRQLADVNRFWTEVAFSTRAADRQEAELAVVRCYKSAGLPAPSVLVWLGSPRAAATCVRLLSSSVEWPTELNQFQLGVWNAVWTQSVRQIEHHMGAQRWRSIRGAIKRQAVKEVEDKYGQYFEPQAKAIFAERLGIEVWRYLRQIAGRPVVDALRTNVEASVKEKVYAAAGSEFCDQVYQVLVPRLRQEMWAPIAEPLRIAIAANNGVLSARQSWDCCYGLHDADWISFYDFMDRMEISGCEQLRGIKLLAQSSGWWWPMSDICILSERPRELHRDNRGRLHNENGMSISYPDGWGLYAWHGILVPEDVIILREPITFEMIESETNAEVRRVLIERFGLDNYLRAGKCVKLHQDACGKLYRMNLPGDEPILVVQVLNSTPEPDGSFNEYFLRVPPGMTRARQAVAWTFGLSEEEYYPIQES